MSFSGHFICSITGCVNSNKKTMESTPLFRVPRTTEAEAWRKALDGLIGNTKIFDAYVCKKHFKREDVYDTCKLRDGAIPTVFPEKYQPLLKKRKTEKPQGSAVEGGRVSLVKLKATREALERELQQLDEQERLLDETVDKLTKEIRKRDLKTPTISPEDMNLLRKCFSPAQIDLFANLSQLPKWDSNDFALAYVIYSMTSREVYDHLRDHVKYPIPKLYSVFRYLKENKSKQEDEDEANTDDEQDVETIQIYTEDAEEEMEEEEEDVGRVELEVEQEDMDTIIINEPEDFSQCEEETGSLVREDEDLVMILEDSEDE